MKFSLGFVLALSLAGLQFLAILIVVSTSYITSERAMLSYARDRLEVAGINASEHSSRFLSPAREAAELSKRVLESGIIAQDDFAELENFMFQSLQTGMQLSGIYYGDVDGNFVYVMRSDGPGPYRTKLIQPQTGPIGAKLIWRDAAFSPVETQIDESDRFDPRSRPWFKAAKAEETVIWTDPYVFFSSRQPGITVAVPVFEQGVLKGVIGVDIEIAAISNFLDQLAVSENGSALILDENGNVVAHPDMTRFISNDSTAELGSIEIADMDDPVAQAVVMRLASTGQITVKTETQSEFEYSGNKYVSLLRPITRTELPWTIALYAPEKDFTQGIKDNRRRNIWLAAGISFVAALAGLALADLILRPVRAFAVRTSLVAQGEVPASAPLPGTYKELEKANETLIHEIAQRREADARIVELGRDLSHFSRVSLLGQMATGLAHELSQPLTAISQNVDAAISTAEQSDTPNKDLLNILTELDEQAHLGGDILSALRGFIQKDRGEMQPFDLNALVKQTESLLQHEASAQGVTLKHEIDDIPPLTGNRVQVAQVLINLVRNAIEAIAQADSPTKEVIVKARAGQGGLDITVEDTGPGIDPDIVLFKQFETSKQSGMGLGLSICRTIVESMDGRLWHDPSFTRGTRFCISLPV